MPEARGACCTAMHRTMRNHNGCSSASSASGDGSCTAAMRPNAAAESHNHSSARHAALTSHEGALHLLLHLVACLSLLPQLRLQALQLGPAATQGNTCSHSVRVFVPLAASLTALQCFIKQCDVCLRLVTSTHCTFLGCARPSTKVPVTWASARKWQATSQHKHNTCSPECPCLLGMDGVQCCCICLLLLLCPLSNQGPVLQASLAQPPVPSPAQQPPADVPLLQPEAHILQPLLLVGPLPPCIPAAQQAELVMHSTLL